MAVHIHLNLESNKIKGESTITNHVDEMEVIAWSWGLSQSGSLHSGTGGGTGRANIQDITLTKYVDTASAGLFAGCCSGQHFANAVLTMTKAAGQSALDYLKIELSPVLVSAYSTGTAGGDERQTENVTLHFGMVKVTYQKQKADGSPDGGPITQGWDIPQNKTWS